MNSAAENTRSLSVRVGHRAIPALALSALLCLTLPACDSREGETDLEEERTHLLILNLATNPTLTDSATACRQATAAGLQCATSAGNAALYSSTYLTPAFQISGTASATLCTSGGANYPGSGVLAPATAAAKVCYFGCERSYWANVQSQGNCSGAGFSAAGAAAFNTINTCSEQCRTTGTFFLF